MDSHQFEQRLLSLEARHQRAAHGFIIAVAIMLVALFAVGRVASRDPGAVTNLDRRVVRAIFAAQYLEEHPIPRGNSPEERSQQSAWMDYELRMMTRYRQRVEGIRADN